MNNKQNNYHAAIELKDGHTTLATWIQPFDHRPKLDDSLKIPVHFQSELSGFESTAVITRIESAAPLPDRIVVEAICLMKKQDRPRIVLNSARIGRGRRTKAESYLRSVLRFPLIYWESGTASAPVVRFHNPVTGRKSCPPDIQTGLLDLLHQPVAASIDYEN